MLSYPFFCVCWCEGAAKKETSGMEIGSSEEGWCGPQHNPRQCEVGTKECVQVHMRVHACEFEYVHV